MNDAKRKRGGLGSGLGALMPETPRASVRRVPVEAILPNPRQPRTRFDDVALDDLAASIREHGIIQPLIVSECDDGTYELIAGERRWRAAQRAGIDDVPVLVREASPQKALELALIENVQRADLNPLEEAQAYQALKDEFGLSDDQIAQRVGKNNRVTVTNTRRLLKLPPQAQNAILDERISAGHGRALLKLATTEQQLAALDVVVANDMSVRETERLGELGAANGGDVAAAFAAVRPARSLPPSSARPARTPLPPRAEPSADDRAIARELERLLGTPVNVARTEKDFRVTITFHTEELLQEFFDRLSS